MGKKCTEKKSGVKGAKGETREYECSGQKNRRGEVIKKSKCSYRQNKVFKINK